jgi:hypothetical protein
MMSVGGIRFESGRDVRAARAMFDTPTLEAP